MKIAGLQKTTLIDYPGKVACTIFLSNCNFRCGFCYNSDLVFDREDNSFSEEYVLNFLKARRGKLEAICITGGEPLLSLEIEFVKKIREMGYLIKIDTNGSLPDKLKEFVDAGLVDYVAMDLKASPSIYSKVVGVDAQIEKLEESIKIISKLPDYEFRTTICNRFHNEEIIKEIGEWVFSVIGKKPKKYFLQGFKNTGTFVDDSFKDEVNIFEEQLVGMKKIADNYFEEVKIRV